MMGQVINALLAAAVTAPSGDNMQPWRFHVNLDEPSIVAEVDPMRDCSPMNVGGRMSRIALGASLENILRAALRMGLDAKLSPAPLPAMASVRWTGAGTVEPTPVNSVLADRVTNRKPYDGRSLPPEILEKLQQETPAIDSVTTHWIVGAERLKTLGELIGRADGTMFGEPSIRHSFLANVRFDAPADEAVDEGLSLNSLELSGSDRISLRMMKHIPDWFLKLAGASQVFAAKARHLITSASGLCLVVAPDHLEWTDLLVGRAMERAWMGLTAHGLAAQPMMSVCVLENIRENGDEALCLSLGRNTLCEIRDQFHSLVPEIGNGRPAFLMRFGFAEPPTGRTGRLSMTAGTTDCDAFAGDQGIGQ